LVLLFVLVLLLVVPNEPGLVGLDRTELYVGRAEVKA
jgi:hypothetical protein